MHKIYTYQYSVLQGISPLNLTPFYLAPPPPKKSKSVSPLPPPLKILEDLTSPLKCALVQKSKDSFFKETKDFISKCNKDFLKGGNPQGSLEFLKGLFLVLLYSYYTLMTFLMILSVILLTIPMILLSTLNVIRHLICGNN